MRRGRRSYQRRPKRPSDRIIRAADTGTIASMVQVNAYVYTAEVPQTVRGLKLDTGITSGSALAGFAYCLVHVPEGYDVNNITYPATTTDLYNPTKNVLISGIITTLDGSEDHKFSSIGRKLATGDRIALIYKNISAISGGCAFELSFSALY